MRRVKRNREQASLLPLELAFFSVGARPDFGRSNAMKNINDFFVEMPFDIQRLAARNFTDVHPRESFHPLELNVSALAPCSRPRFSRQLSNVFYAVPIDEGDIFFTHPFFVAGFSINHVNPVLSVFWTENILRASQLPPTHHPPHPNDRVDSRTKAS